MTASSPDRPGGPSATPSPAPRAQEGRHLVFVVDDLSLAPESILRTKAALSRVVDQQLGPADRVAIVRTGGEAGLYQQFTGDRTILRSLVGRIRYNMSGRGLPDSDDRTAGRARPHAGDRRHRWHGRHGVRD